MGFSTPLNPGFPIPNNEKVKALEESLNKSVQNFKELILDLELMRKESQEDRKEYSPKCEKACVEAEELRKIIASKDQIIQSVASILTKLNETKNFDVLTEAFKILFEEVAPLTPPTDDSSHKTHTSGSSNKVVNPAVKTTGTKSSESKDADMSITEDIYLKEESACEIEGTPTGRVSPILQTKRCRTMLSKTDVRDKKKCSTEWPTSDSKSAKFHLTPCKQSTPRGGRLRQSRLNLVKMHTTTVVDLTCSPELVNHKGDQYVQPLIKKESSEFDDTILPSPTSEPTNFTLLKTSLKASPCKFKKPKGLSLKSRSESMHQDENRYMDNTTHMEDSINILNQQLANRLREAKKENISQVSGKLDKDTTIAPIKGEKISPGRTKSDVVKREILTDTICMEVHDDDATNASISLLNHLDRIEEKHKRVNQSPIKRPLSENMNVTNTPPKDTETSMSLLHTNKPALDTVKRKIPELVEPVYKEPAVRKKAEKRNLQGWSCEECKNFYGTLYKDDPVMLAKKINECSKHRARHNPARPRTPPNFWNPRWTVPDDTEELNRMNNAE